MLLGKVFIDLSYVVDLDNKIMVDEACECLIEDLKNMCKYGKYPDFDFISDKSLTIADIPSFLTEELDYELQFNAS
jgi:hypothetical protein